MTEITFYGIAELDPNGQPVKYLPFFGQDYPDTKYWLTADRAQAWRFADKETAQERSDVLNSINPGRHLKVIELDGQGPPLV
jgi:hypothetical protein